MLTSLTAQDILQAAARLHKSQLIYCTPLEKADKLSEDLGIEFWQKLELYQQTGSFKLRGATNKLLALLEESQANDTTPEILTISAGNHGLGIAHAAKHLKMKATVVVPKVASAAKVEALRRYPITLIQQGDSYEAAEIYSRQLERESGLTFASPYNDFEVMAGQGTIAVEVLQDLPQADVLLVPTGGGGLISGVALWAKTVKPSIKVIGVQSEASPAMHHAFTAGKLVPAPDLPSLADGLAGALEVDTVTFEYTKRYVDEIVMVSEEAIAEAIRYYASHQHLIVEGSGAVGLAALLEGKLKLSSSSRVVNIITGRNIAATTLAKVLSTDNHA